MAKANDPVDESAYSSRVRKSLLVDDVGTPISEDNPLPIINFSQLVPEIYDQVSMTEITSGNGIGEIGTITYKLAAATVATLTLTYSSTNFLLDVVRS